MVIVAEAAVWLLRPRDAPPEPVPVAEARLLQRRPSSSAPTTTAAASAWLLIAGLAVEGAVLVARRARPPGAAAPPARAARRAAAARRRASPAPRSPLLTTVATLPLGLISHERAVDAGLSTQSLGPWLWDVARSAGITALLTAGGAALLLALVRRFPRRWWLPGAARDDRARGRSSSGSRRSCWRRSSTSFEPLPERQPRPRRRARARPPRPGSRSARSTGSTPAAG